MTLRILEFCGDIFDRIHHALERPATQRRISAGVFWIFIAALAGVAANRLGMLPQGFILYVPHNFLEAINLAFTLMLALELLSLVIAISSSLSQALAKQIQVLGLILLRNAFKELTHLHDPINIALDWESVLNIGILGAAALVVFICLGLYQRLPQATVHLESELRVRYMLSKKMLGLVLLAVFAYTGLDELRIFLGTGNNTSFFETIYTVLIFADVALVLIAQRYMQSFHAMFRNAGFVLATLLIRIALGSPPPWDALIGIGAMLYSLALTWAIARFEPPAAPSQSEEQA